MKKILLTVPAFIISITASSFDLAKGVPVNYYTSYETKYIYYINEKKRTSVGYGVLDCNGEFTLYSGYQTAYTKQQHIEQCPN